MRIIAGRFKGRRLKAPAGLTVRPTSDSLRETLFNILGESINDARVMDAFAGTGALGLEALSRGATHVTFVERDARVIRVLGDNIALCGGENACAIIRGDFLSAEPSSSAFDVVLLDPPYDIKDAQAVMNAAARFVEPGGQVVFEHSRRQPSPDRALSLQRVRVVTAGDSALSFYVAAT